MNAMIVGTLNSISAKLTTAVLLQMDTAIIIQHADYATVAADSSRPKASADPAPATVPLRSSHD